MCIVLYSQTIQILALSYQNVDKYFFRLHKNHDIERMITSLSLPTAPRCFNAAMASLSLGECNITVVLALVELPLLTTRYLTV